MDLNRTEGFIIDNGVFAPLVVPGSIQTVAWDVNPRGDVVGVYRNAAGFHGFVQTEVGFTTIDEIRRAPRGDGGDENNAGRRDADCDRDLEICREAQIILRTGRARGRERRQQRTPSIRRLVPGVRVSRSYC